MELQKLCDKVQQGIGNRRGSMAVVNVGEEMMKHVKMSGDIISNFFKNSFAHRKKTSLQNDRPSFEVTDNSMK